MAGVAGLARPGRGADAGPARSGAPWQSNGPLAVHVTAVVPAAVWLHREFDPSKERMSAAGTRAQKLDQSTASLTLAVAVSTCPRRVAGKHLEVSSCRCDSFWSWQRKRDHTVLLQYRTTRRLHQCINGSSNTLNSLARALEDARISCPINHTPLTWGSSVASTATDIQYLWLGVIIHACEKSLGPEQKISSRTTERLVA